MHTLEDSSGQAPRIPRGQGHTLSTSQHGEDARQAIDRAAWVIDAVGFGLHVAGFQKPNAAVSSSVSRLVSSTKPRASSFTFGARLPHDVSASAWE
jgi:hypothetical protein